MEKVHFDLRINPEDIKTLGKIKPYPFQWEIFTDCIKYMREQFERVKKGEPAQHGFVNAYVSAGKTIMIGALCNYFTQKKVKALVITRTGELVLQNHEECWNMNAPASMFSASGGRKSVNDDYYVVVGSEKTIWNDIENGGPMSEFVPIPLVFDECHEVDWRDACSEEPKTLYGKIIKYYKAKSKYLTILGFTGTPYRHTEGIKDKKFWVNQVGRSIDRNYLVSNGYIVPTLHDASPDELNYDVSAISPDTLMEEGTADISPEQLKKFEEMNSPTKTHKIMMYVLKRMNELKRISALVTCASKKHCYEAASVLEDGTWAIITDDTPPRERKDILDKAKAGKMRFVFQIGCLTTGVNVPPWDTSVILRPIGSLTLLTQLLGRGMRLLKDEHLKAGMVKVDHLVFDFTDTLSNMHELFDDPILSAAADVKRRKKTGVIICPLCKTENNGTARRCNHVDPETKLRCSHFWQSVPCRNPACLDHAGQPTKNDIKAKSCRVCDFQLVDPNKALTNKHYTNTEYKRVVKMESGPTKTGGVFFRFVLEKNDIGQNEVASVFFNPFKSEGGRRVFDAFVAKFFDDYKTRSRIVRTSNINDLVAKLPMFRTPTYITHRIGEKNNSIINRVVFEEIEDRS